MRRLQIAVKFTVTVKQTNKQNKTMNEQPLESSTGPTASAFEPLDYKGYQASRLELLAPAEREIEQQRIDSLPLEDRDTDQNRWKSLTSEQRANEHAALFRGRWIGPGYILQSQIRGSHPSIEESWELRGLTSQQITNERQAIMNARTKLNTQYDKRRDALNLTADKDGRVIDPRNPADLGSPASLKNTADIGKSANLGTL